jgi:hypothetical protein
MYRERIYRSKLVQVVKVFDSFNAVMISDTRHLIVVFLTSSSATQLRNDLRSMNILKHSFCKLDYYHVSTVLQCASNRDLDVVCNQHKVSLPFALQASSLTLIGNSDISVIDEPVDINSDAEIKEIRVRFPYIAIANKLILQFASKGIHQLPDAGMLSLVFSRSYVRTMSLLSF